MNSPESIAVPPKPTLLAAILCDTAAMDRFQAKVVHRRTEAVIAQGSWHASVADPLKGSDYTVDLPPLQLPEAGRDEFHRYANTQYLGNATLDACGFPTTGEKEAA